MDDEDHRADDRSGHPVSDGEVTTRSNPWRRRCLIVLSLWALVTVLLGFKEVRGVLIMPLVVHDEEAEGEIAYVMADGVAYWERLRAASDLYHWHRITKIYLPNELDSDGWHFTKERSYPRIERATEYLGLWGVPPEAVEAVPMNSQDWMSSRGEAVNVSKLPGDFESIVVVTSAPHTRRSKMCFQRVLGGSTRIQVYSASGPHESAETYAPIWMEYFKLSVYWCFA